MSLTDDAHLLIRQHFGDKPTLLAVDATCGNGHDTEFLITLGFHNIVAFDVQEIAIEATRKRLKHDKTVTLFQDSHANLESYIKQEIDCLMFNFGYLPTGNKEITTKTESSIDALNSGLTQMSQHGLISLMCYPGHPTGKHETEAIKNWFISLNSKDWHVETHLAASPKPTAPILYLIKRVQAAIE